MKCTSLVFSGPSVFTEGDMRRRTMRQAGFIAVTIAVVGVCSLGAVAQEGIQQLAQTAKEKINPPGKDELQKRLTDLRSAADRLSNYLRGANGEAWKAYLRWNDLQQQLQAGDQPDPTVLTDVRRQFVANHPGLELPVFANVARALDRAIIGVEASRADDFRGTVEMQIDDLAKNVDEYASN